MVNSYQAPFGLSNPHIQTVISSVLRKKLRPAHVQAFLAASQERIITVAGVKLLVHTNHIPDAPQIVLIPGWLGSAASSYIQSAGAYLAAAGFSVTRVNLRDHGDTAHLNPGLFHSALIDEVVALVELLSSETAKSSGIMGFSLGGNFALRVATALPQLRTLAIAPAIQPRATMGSIDRNLIYQRYFVTKWRRVWAQKQKAFPELYDFSPAMKISTVSALTDYFIRHQATEFASTDEYFAAYDLAGERLAGVTARVLVAEDDPIIPATHFDALPNSLEIETTPQGGHTAYLNNWRLESWVDDYAVRYFKPLLDS